MGWAADLKIAIENLAMECVRLHGEQRVANTTIDELTDRIFKLEQVLQQVRIIVGAPR